MARLVGVRTTRGVPEAQVDFFYVGLWDDPETGRRRKLYAFLLTLSHVFLECPAFALELAVLLHQIALTTAALGFGRIPNFWEGFLEPAFEPAHEALREVFAAPPPERPVIEEEEDEGKGDDHGLGDRKSVV